MSFDPETTRIVRSWLDEGVTQLPDRVLDAVLDQIPATPQRRASWRPMRNSRPTRSTLAVAVAAASVVLAIGLIAFGLVTGPRVGGPGTEEDAGPRTPAIELPDSFVPLEPGRYRLREGFPFDVTLEVPGGWMACAYSDLEQGVCASTDAGGVSILAVESVVVHPCNTVLRDPPAGRSVDAFLAAVAGLAGFTATEPIEITRGGLVGKQITVTAPSDPQCQALGTWSVPGRTNGVHAGEVNIVEAFEVGGRVVAVTGAYRPRVLAPEEIAEIRLMMESVQIAP